MFVKTHFSLFIVTFLDKNSILSQKKVYQNSFKMSVENIKSVCALESIWTSPVGTTNSVLRIPLLPQSLAEGLNAQ